MLTKIKSLIFSKTAKDALIVLGGSGFSALFGLVFVGLVGRRIGPENFGIFSTIINYMVFVAAVVDLGISQSLVRFVQEHPREKDRKTWLSTGLATVIVSSFFLAIIATLIYLAVLTKLWNHSPHFTWYVFPTIIAITLATFFMGFYQSLSKFWYRAIIDNIFSTSRLIVIGILIIYSPINIEWGMGSIIIAYIITIVIAWYLGRKYIDFSLITKLKTKKLLHFSKWLAGINLFGNLYGKLDVMMLAWLSSAYATGIYAAAARFILIFPLVVASLSSVVAPRFANRTNVQSLHQYFKKTILISCGLTAIMSTLILLAKTLIILAYEEAFLDAIPVFQLLVVAFLPLILSIPATNAIIYFFKKPKIITFIATAQLTGLVLLNLTVIPRYGVFGPVYSLIAMNLFGMICQYVSYFYLYKKSK